jgi:glycogen operon protein
MRLNGDAIDEADERGERVVGDTLLVLFNAGDDAEPFTLPTAESAGWEILVDTTDPWTPARRLRAGERYELQPLAMAVMRLCRGSSDS